MILNTSLWLYLNSYNDIKILFTNGNESSLQTSSYITCNFVQYIKLKNNNFYNIIK
jgi:hypothetical protein